MSQQTLQASYNAASGPATLPREDLAYVYRQES